MDQIIRFRSLADTLSESEFNCFLAQFCAEHGRRRILTQSLFHLFHAQFHRDSFDGVHSAIRSISAIIKARDDSPEDKATLHHWTTPPVMEPTMRTVKGETTMNTNPTTTRKRKRKREREETAPTFALELLPKELIGECGSFLHYDSYHNLMKCSRAIYVGLTAPVTVRSLHKRVFVRAATVRGDVVRRQHLQIAQFRCLTHFGLDVNAFIAMTALHQMALPRSTTSLSLYNSNQNSMRSFLDTVPWDFGQIAMLKVHCYAMEWKAGPEDVCKAYCAMFCRILSTFSGVRYLELQGMDVVTYSVIDRLGRELDTFHGALLGQLEGLCLYETDAMKALFYDKLLALCSQQLLSLHVDAPIAAPGNGLRRLREICIYNANCSKLGCIVQSEGAKRLERIHLELIADHVDDRSEQARELEEMLVELWSGPALQSISIKMDRDIACVHRALQRATRRKRGKMRGKLYIKDEIGDALRYLDALTDLLKESAHDYIVKFRCVLTRNMEGKVTTFGCKVGDVLRLTRSNADCKLHGYRDQWLYPCVCNK